MLLAAAVQLGCLVCLGEGPGGGNGKASGAIVGAAPWPPAGPGSASTASGPFAATRGPTSPAARVSKRNGTGRDVRFSAARRVPGCWHYKTGEHCPYNNVVWFKRAFRIPAEWNRGRIWLHVGGVKPAAAIWLNDVYLGNTVTSRSPIKVDLTAAARRGEENTLAICVSWPEVRMDGVWDHQDIDWWDGIYRSVFIEQTPDAWIDNVHVQTTVAQRTARVEVVIGGGRPGAAGLPVRCTIRPWKGESPVYAGKGQLRAGADGVFGASIDVDMKGSRLWSPADPCLYVARASLLGADGKALDEAEVRFRPAGDFPQGHAGPAQRPAHLSPRRQRRTRLSPQLRAAQFEGVLS